MQTELVRETKRTLGPRLSLKEANLICWGLFFALLAPALYHAVLGQEHLGRGIPDADFVNFYAMGRIFSQYPPARLYDGDLQNSIRTQIHPLSSGFYGLIPYPPFVAMAFAPLARLPYATAYLLWLAVTLTLYVAALIMVCRRFFAADPLRWSLAVCLGVAFLPFALETLANGQLSAIGFFAMALAFLLADSGRYFPSGLALSLCAYKPTLLLLVVPMLLVSRQFKALAGILAGSAGLCAATTLAAGTGVWPAFFSLLFHFGHASVGVQTGSILNLSKYVDLAAFSALLPHGRSPAVLLLLAGCACWAAMSLVQAWWHAPAAGHTAMRLAWAATLTWTLLLNLYVPVYDTILVVLSVIITAGVWKKVRRDWYGSLAGILVTLIFTAPWFAGSLADDWHVQVQTVLLGILGAAQLRLIRLEQKERPGPAQVSPR